MSEMDREHAWAHPRLPLLVNGLLDDEEVTRVEAHVDECAQCSLAYEPDDKSVATPGLDHIPRRLLSTWPKAQRSLRGLQRELVRRHLDSCGQCRQVLRWLGHEPSLPHMAELEPKPEVMELLRAEVPGSDSPLAPEVAHGPPQRQIVELPRRRWSFREFWAGGALGGLAAAAAVLLLVVGPPAGNAPAVRPSTGAAVVTGSLSISSGAADRYLVTRAGEGLERGGSADSTLVLQPGQRTIRLGFTQIVGLPQEAALEVILRTAQGTVVDRFRARYSDLLQGEAGLAVTSPTPFEPGRFVVEFRWTASDGSGRFTEYPLILRR